MSSPETNFRSQTTNTKACKRAKKKYSSRNSLVGVNPKKVTREAEHYP